MQQDKIEVSVIMPCLNEAKTVGICVRKAQGVFKRHRINGEVIIVDNGSTDNSVEIAKKEGAKIVHQPVRGYGSAYLKGIEEAEGNFIIIGDADDTYDFSEIDKFVNRLRDEFEFVSGSRLKGHIKKGAMSWLHRYIGNPGLTWLLNLIFKSRLSDAYCGFKAFTREAYKRMNPLSLGMEFCLELVIKSSLFSLKSTEIPITLYARQGESKLRTFRDGWRSLRFIFLFSPNYLFLLPGTMLFILGVFLLALTNDFKSIMLGGLGTILGFQILIMWLFARQYSSIEGYTPKTRFLKRFYRYCKIEHGIMLGFLLFIAGLVINFHFLGRGINYMEEYTKTKIFLLSFILIIFGIQTVLASFFISLLGLKDKDSLW